MEQFVLLLIIGAISLVNWIIQKSAEHREKRKAERARGDSFRPTTDESKPQQPTMPFDPSEQTRKFLEALGLPEDALPPRPAPPPLPSEMSSAPAKRDFLHKIQPDLEQRLFGESTSFGEPPIVVSKPRPSPTAAARVTVSPSSTARGLVTGLMSEKDGLRRAIVMREILGPPKALQS